MIGFVQPRQNFIYGANGWTDLVGDLWLFGGQDYQGTNNSVWRFSIGSHPKNPQWENLTPTNVGSAWPSARTHHACWTGNDGGLYLFGGSSGDFNAHSDQLWRFDSATASMQFEVEVNKSVNISPALKDPGNIADLKIVSTPLHGTVSPIKEGTRTVGFVYTPQSNHIGDDSFSIGLNNSPCVDPKYVKPIKVKILPAQTSGITNWGLYD